ncbi:MAG: hypothetical protein J6Y37_09100 [Paludibacteraceae bacterium]|nr:hypothetical protein [Paludibacteraceae bacterium]
MKKVLLFLTAGCLIGMLACSTLSRNTPAIVLSKEGTGEKPIFQTLQVSLFGGTEDTSIYKTLISEFIEDAELSDGDTIIVRGREFPYSPYSSIKIGLKRAKYTSFIVQHIIGTPIEKSGYDRIIQDKFGAKILLTYHGTHKLLVENPQTSYDSLMNRFTDIVIFRKGE